MRLRRALAPLAFALLLAPSARAQQGTPNESGSAVSLAVRRADSLAAYGDTAGALALLDSLVHREPRNAVLWYRRGALAMAKGRRALIKGGLLMKREDIDLLRTADTSLRLAVQLAPDSGRYALGLAHYFFSSGQIQLRVQGPGKVRQALTAAQRAGDSALLSQTRDERGMIYWRRYEAVADRRVLNGIHALSVDALLSRKEGMRELLESKTVKLDVDYGRKDYDRAVADFAAASAADPNNQRAFRHAMMALAEKERWDSLRALAGRRLTTVPWDDWAWLGRALASHRLGDEGDAARAIDSALTLLSPADRARLTRVTRLLRPKDSAAVAAMPAAARADLERLYWLVADPLAMTPGNEYWLEFMARVIYAELRWTSDDFDLHGADTDRGDVYVRFGPPPVKFSLAPNGDDTQSCYSAEDNDEGGTDLSCSGTSEGLVGVQVWYYPQLNLHFVFRAPPTFGTASFTGSYYEIAEAARDAAPASWANVPINKHAIDTIPVQLTRFRATADSADVLVFADVPAAKLTSAVAADTAPLDVVYMATDLAGRPAVRDSSRRVVRKGESAEPQHRAWRSRLGAGTLLYRVEALQPDSLRAARAMGELRVAPERGFGVSDLLVTRRVVPRDAMAARWTDFTITPSVGRFARGETVGLLWEVYDLDAGAGSAKYRVSVTLAAAQKKGVSALAAKVVAGAGAVVGRSAQGKDRVTLTFDREAPASRASATADYLTLELGAAPAGRYTLTVEVTDLTTHSTATRQREITIEK